MRTLKEKNVRLSIALDQFFLDCQLRNLSDRTVQWYRDNLTPIIRDNLTADDIKAYIISLKGRLSANTINGKIRSLKSFFAYCEREEVCLNIMKDISTLKEKQQTIKPFTKEQVKALLKQPDKKTFSGLRDYVIMATMIDTGLRVSELLSIRKKDIKENITVTGKGNKERTVPIGKHLRKILNDYLTQLSDLSEDDFIFITVHDNQLDRHRLNKRLKEHAIKAKVINVRVSAHTFRHTFAIYYLHNGGNIFYLQNILGHTTLDMTKKYLQHLDDDVLSAHSTFSPLDNIKKVRK